MSDGERMGTGSEQSAVGIAKRDGGEVPVPILSSPPSDTAVSGGDAVVLFTIGFTGKSAQQFFEMLMRAGVKKLVDTRLNNVSQLAGFTKRRDLEFFLRPSAGSTTFTIRSSLRPKTSSTITRKSGSIGPLTKSIFCN